MIFVGGLSGSGKTTLVKAFVSGHPSYTYLSASEILRSMNRPTAGLNEADALENQTVLARWLGRLPSVKRASAILDGHGTVIVREGMLKVPLEFFRGLSLRKIVLVVGDPAVILRIRVWPPTFDSEMSIKSLQRQEAEILKGVASELHVSMHEVASSDFNHFEAIIAQRN